jgi:hypothetical protein
MDYSFPQVAKIRQKFHNSCVTDVASEVIRGVGLCVKHTALPPGSRVAITVGSRGIRHIVDILNYTVQALKDHGYEPFLVSAMGSHGGGKQEGQLAVLASLGITEASIHAPVVASGETIRLGETSKLATKEVFSELCLVEGLPVYMAKEALDADAIFVVNRIKPHTAFHGDYESGLMKMLAVGLGRAPGADSVHRLGAARMSEAIPSIAGYILSHTPVWGGLGIVENGYDEPAIIRGIPSELIPLEEKALLESAKMFMPAIPLKGIDLCLIGEMGKNFSGTGIDTNVIGRMRIHGIPEPVEPGIQYVGILGLSEASHGNATGIGLADFTTRCVADQIDSEVTYLNCLTSGFTARAAIPIIAQHDRDLLEKALVALKTEDPAQLRLVILKNTLQLDELWVTQPLLHELVDQPGIEVIEEACPLTFDQQGRLELLHS